MMPTLRPGYSWLLKGVDFLAVTEAAMARPRFRSGKHVAGRVRARGPCVAALVAALATCGPALAAGQPQEGIDGAGLYRQHCASCHGSGGWGDGPIADRLRNAPPALATLARRHAGTFPTDYVYRIVDGREERRAHGGRDMPVWGSFYGTQVRWQGGGADTESAIQQRILALIAHLESIQVAYATDAGADETAATEDLLERHVTAFGARDLGAVMGNYGDDSVLVIPTGVLRGTEEIGDYYRALFAELAKPGAVFNLLERSVVGNVAHIAWTGETAANVYEHTAETLSVADGKIRYQITAFRSRVKK